jgi:hypothetical protein
MVTGKKTAFPHKQTQLYVPVQEEGTCYTHIFAYFGCSSNFTSVPPIPGPLHPVLSCHLTAKLPVSGKGGSSAEKSTEQMFFDVFSLRCCRCHPIACHLAFPPPIFLPGFVFTRPMTSISLQAPLRQETLP